MTFIGHGLNMCHLLDEIVSPRANVWAYIKLELRKMCLSTPNSSLKSSTHVCYRDGGKVEAANTLAVIKREDCDFWGWLQKKNYSLFCKVMLGVRDHSPLR